MVWLLLLVIGLIVSEIISGFIKRELKLLKDEKNQEDSQESYFSRRNLELELEKIEKQEKFMKMYQKYSRIAIISLIVISTFFGSFFSINEQNIAVVTTFGKPEEVTETGLHFKIPYIQKVKKIDSTIQGFPIGYSEEDGETQQIDSLMITSDFNFVNVDFYVEYKVTDAIQYLYGSSNPEGILKNIAQSCVRNTIGRYNVDFVLTTGKSEIQAVIKEAVIKELEQSNTGLSLVNITIQDAEPPTEAVLNAFQQVEQAKQNAEKGVNEAEQYKNEQLPQANANADEIRRQAEATRQERIDEATGEVAMFNAMYAEYIKNPDVSKIRMYYEAMEEVMPDLQIIVNGTDAEIKPIIVQQEVAQEGK